MTNRLRVVLSCLWFRGAFRVLSDEVGRDGTPDVTQRVELVPIEHVS